MNRRRKAKGGSANTIKLATPKSVLDSVGASHFLPQKQVQVEVSLRGGFRFGEVQVEGVTIPLAAATGKGKLRVDVTPPTIDVEVSIAAPGPCGFEFEIKIGNKKGKRDGIMKYAGRQRFSFQFALSDFGL